MRIPDRNHQLPGLCRPLHTRLGADQRGGDHLDLPSASVILLLQRRFIEGLTQGGPKA